MTPFAQFPTDERVLRQERIHPGIFVVPAVVLVGLGMLTLPVMVLTNSFRGIYSGFGLQPQPAFGLPWLFILAADILITAAVFCAALVAYLNCRVTVTNRRLIYTTGLFARNSGEVSLENIDAVFLEEPLLGRLFGYGTVTVFTLGGAPFQLGFLPKPHVFHVGLQTAAANAKADVHPPSRSPTALAPATSQPSEPQDDSRYMPKS